MNNSEFSKKELDTWSAIFLGNNSLITEVDYYQEFGDKLGISRLDAKLLCFRILGSTGIITPWLVAYCESEEYMALRRKHADWVV